MKPREAQPVSPPKETEEEVRELIAQLTALIAKNPSNPKTKEVRDFINKHGEVGNFKELAITLLLLAEEEKETISSETTPLFEKNEYCDW